MRVHTAAVAVVCGLLLASGCGETSPAPKPPDTKAASTTPTPSVEPGPTMPPAAKRKGAKGAEAFVRHYVDLINYAQATGDVRGLASAGGDECEPCSDGVRYIREIYSSGGSIEGGSMRIERLVNNLKFPGVRGRTLDLLVQVRPEVVTKDGKVRQRDGGPATVSFNVQQSGSSWTVSHWSADTQ